MARQHHSNKAIPAGATKAVVAAFLNEAGGSEGMDSIALQLGVSMSRAYQLQDDATLTLDHAAVLTWNTKAPQAAEYLATLAGGQFVPVQPLNEPVSDLVARFAKEGGEVVQAAIAMLTAPGAPYALEPIVANGRPIRAFVGTPHSIADEMAAWLDARACDGFNVMFPYLPAGLDDVIDKVILPADIYIVTQQLKLLQVSIY